MTSLVSGSNTPFYLTYPLSCVCWLECMYEGEGKRKNSKGGEGVLWGGDWAELGPESV